MLISLSFIFFSLSAAFARWRHHVYAYALLLLFSLMPLPSLNTRRRLRHDIRAPIIDAFKSLILLPADYIFLPLASRHYDFRCRHFDTLMPFIVITPIAIRR